jgi:hypothetical protein
MITIPFRIHTILPLSMTWAHLGEALSSAPFFLSPFLLALLLCALNLPRRLVADAFLGIVDSWP